MSRTPLAAERPQQQVPVSTPQSPPIVPVRTTPPVPLVVNPTEGGNRVEASRTTPRTVEFAPRVSQTVETPPPFTSEREEPQRGAPTQLYPKYAGPMVRGSGGVPSFSQESAMGGKGLPVSSKTPRMRASPLRESEVR